MSLLIFKPEQWAQQQQYPTSSSTTAAATTNGTSSSSAQPFGVLADLVDPSLRQKVAKDVNEAILQSQGQQREARIRKLVRARAWAEKTARDKKIDLPAKMDLGLDRDEGVVRSGAAGGPNGHANGVSGSGGDTAMTENGPATGTTGNGESTARARVEGDAALAQFTDLSALS